MSDRDVPLAARRVKSFRRTLLTWYDQHHRDLPWRRDRDPYRVWISEVMLQQTRVAAVLDHYARFMRKFPTVQALAWARVATVLAAWIGLGYYHRARRMHQAARIIARERRGEFPRTAEEWLQLPGIGRYTAAAIASIAFSEPIAVVDGNVERVLQRLFGPDTGRKDVWHRASALLEWERPGDFNQAMMEFGATICTPRAPQCPACPLRQFCQLRGVGDPQPHALRKREELSYAFARKGTAAFLVQRSKDASLMAGMWELPQLSPEQVNGHTPLLRLRHSITDTDYRVTVFPASDRPTEAKGRWLAKPAWQRLPLTGLARKILTQLCSSASERKSRVSNCA